MNSSKQVNNLYKKYKEHCDELFGEGYLNELDESQRKYYVYAWYTETKPPKYFYVGKGTGDRWRHVKNDIKRYDKSNKKNERLRHLSLINKKYRISCEILLSNLTKNEALIAEECVKLDYSSSGEVLINEENWFLNSEQKQNSNEDIIVSDFWERYIGHEELFFDRILENSLSGKTIFYPFHICKTIEKEEAERLVANYIIMHGGKIQKKINMGRLKNKSVFAWPGQLHEESYVKMRRNGAKIYSFKDAIDYIKTIGDDNATRANTNIDLRISEKDKAFLVKKREMTNYIKQMLIEAGANETDIEESEYHDEIHLTIKNHGFVSFLCYKKKPGGNITIPLDYADGISDLLINITSWKGDFIFAKLDELEQLKPFFRKQVKKQLS